MEEIIRNLKKPLFLDMQTWTYSRQWQGNQINTASIWEPFWTLLPRGIVQWIGTHASQWLTVQVSSIWWSSCHSAINSQSSVYNNCCCYISGWMRRIAGEPLAPLPTCLLFPICPLSLLSFFVGKNVKNKSRASYVI